MSYSFDRSQTEANLIAGINALTGNEDIYTFLEIKKGANGLAITNIDTLNGYIQTLATNQSTSTPIDEVVAASIAMSPGFNINEYYDTQTYSANGSVAVPANAVSALVSAKAADSAYSGGIDGSEGARVVDFPIGVSGGGTLNIVWGASIEVGGLVLSAGSSSNPSISGKVVLSGTNQTDDGLTVFNGGYRVLSSGQDTSQSTITVKYLIKEPIV